MLGFDALSEAPLSALPENEPTPPPPPPPPPPTPRILNVSGGSATGGAGYMMFSKGTVPAFDPPTEIPQSAPAAPKEPPKTSWSPLLVGGLAIAGTAAVIAALRSGEDVELRRDDDGDADEHTQYVDEDAGAFEEWDARENPRAEMRDTGLDELTVAKGRPMTRRCGTCGEDKPLHAFPRGGARKCVACREAGVERVFTRECVVCGKAFETASSKALVCSPACRKERNAELRAATRDRSRRG